MAERSLLSFVPLFGLQSDLIGNPAVLPDLRTYPPEAPESAARPEAAPSHGSGRGSSRSGSRVTLKIVGIERGGGILISRSWREGRRARKVNVVDMFTVSDSLCQVLYAHKAEDDIVQCTVDRNALLIAFVTTRDYRAFTTYVAEIRAGSACYTLDSPPGETPHFVQFLRFDSDPPAGRTWNVLYFLHVVPGEAIRVFRATFKPVPHTGGVALVGAPSRSALLLSKFDWWQWDSVRSQLCVIHTARPGRVSFRCYGFRDRRQLLSEKPLKEAFVLFETALLLDSGLLLPSAESVTSLRAVTLEGERLPSCLCVQQQDTAAERRTLRVTVVLLQPQQSAPVAPAKVLLEIPLDDPPPTAAARRSASTTLRPSAVFDTVGEGLLLVYLPGRFVGIVDCGEDHHPKAHLSLFGPLFAGEVPQAEATVETCISPFEFLPDASTVVDHKSGVVYRLSLNPTGILHLFSADVDPSVMRKAVHFVVAHLHDVDLLATILARVCLHHNLLSVELMKEYVLATTYSEVARRARLVTVAPVELGLSLSCFQSEKRFHLGAHTLLASSAATTAAAAAASRSFNSVPTPATPTSSSSPSSSSSSPSPSLTGTTTPADGEERDSHPRADANSDAESAESVPDGVGGSAAASPAVGDSLPAHLLHAHPRPQPHSSTVAQSPSTPPSSASPSASPSPSPSFLRPSSAASANAVTPPPPPSAPSLLGSLAGRRLAAPATPSGTPPPGIKSFLRDLLGMEELPPLSRSSARRSTPEEDRVLCDQLATFLSHRWPKEKAAAQYVAAQYVSLRGVVVDQLFSTIMAADTTDAAKFSLLQNLFTAMEELSLPWPRAFNATFARLAFASLPRASFLQFADCGVFALDERLVSEILSDPRFARADATIADLHFLSEMAACLPDQRLVWNMFKRNRSLHRYLAQQILACSSALPRRPKIDESGFLDTEDLDRADRSPFTPLSFLLTAVREGGLVDERDVDFVCEATSAAVLDTLNVAAEGVVQRASSQTL